MRKLAGNPASHFLARYASLKAADFLVAERPGVAEKKELLALAGLLLDQEDIADLAVDRLRRWGCWDFTDRVLALSERMFTSKKPGTLVRRAVLRYALRCPDARCKAFVAAQRRRDPGLVRETEELLELEDGGGPKPPSAIQHFTNQ
jgi:hypothetical protein